MKLTRGPALGVGLALAVQLTGCSGHAARSAGGAQTAPQATPVASTAPGGNAPATAAPLAPAPLAAPAASPTPLATGGAALSTAPAAHPKPAILSVSVSPMTVHEGDTVSWSVTTTPDVTSVEAHVRVATIPFQKAAPGHFTMAINIPKSVPGFFHASYTVDIVGHAGDGETLTRSVPLEFR